MQGAADLLQTETSPFKSEPTNYGKWKSVALSWRNSPPEVSVIDPQVSTNDALVLEVVFVHIILRRYDRVEAQMFMRVVDPETKEILGNTTFIVGKGDINPVTLTTRPDSFVSDFRRCARDWAAKGLKMLNLI